MFKFDVSTGVIIADWTVAQILGRDDELEFVIDNEERLYELKSAFPQVLSNDDINLHEKKAYNIVETTSSLLHEKRHYIDWHLTNYMSYKFRLYLTIYANIPFIVDYAPNNDFIVPINYNANFINRKCYKANVQDSDFLKLCADIHKRKSNLSLHKQFIDGDVLVEGMAYYFQRSYIQSAIGYDKVDVLMRKYENAEWNYRWWISILQKYKLANVINVTNTYGILNTSILAPLLLGSLSIDSKHNDESAYISGLRLKSILDVIEGIKVSTPLDGFELVNKTCKKKWGVDIFEAIERDIVLCEEFLDCKLAPLFAPLGNDYELLQLVRKYIQKRKDILNILRNSPLDLLDNEPFERSLKNFDESILLNTSLQGVLSRKADIYPIDYDNFDGKTLIHSWLRKKSENYHSYIKILYETYSPIAKYLLDGKADVTILPWKLHAIEKIIQGDKWKIKYFIGFDERPSTVGQFCEIKKLLKNPIVCDICMQEITDSNGKMVSRDTITNSDALLSKIRLLKPDLDEILLTDWSDWIVPEKCLS